MGKARLQQQHPGRNRKQPACIKEPTREESTRLSHCLPVPAYRFTVQRLTGWVLGQKREEGGAASEKQRSPPPPPSSSSTTATTIHHHIHICIHWREEIRNKKGNKDPPHLHSFARGDKKQKGKQDATPSGRGSHVHHPPPTTQNTT